MLIGDLPQDVTPSVDGTVPYSEDGIHLNFIKIQDLLGLGGGGDGGGTGNFSEIEFPDGTKGYYISSSPYILESDNGDSKKMGDPYPNKAFTFTCAKIMRHPERYFSAYFEANVHNTGESVKFINAPGNNKTVELPIIDKQTGGTYQQKLGYRITNNDYTDYPNGNFPFLVYSSKQTMVSNTNVLTSYYHIYNDDWVPTDIVESSGETPPMRWSSWYNKKWSEDATPSNPYINSTTGLPKGGYMPDNWEDIFEKVQLHRTGGNYPLLHMLFPRLIADRIYDNYRFDPDGDDPSEPIGEIYIIPTDINQDSEIYDGSNYFGRSDDPAGRNLPFEHLVQYPYGNGLITRLYPFDIDLQQVHTYGPYTDAEVDTAVSNIDPDMYERSDLSDDIFTRLKLFDVWSSSAYGTFCFHVIDEFDEEYWLYTDDEEPYSWMPPLIDDNDKLSPLIWQDSWYNAKYNTTYLNYREVHKDYTPWVEADVPGDINPNNVDNTDFTHIKHFNSPNDAMSWINVFVLGIDIPQPVASYMYSDNGGFGALVPTKRKLIYDWWLERSELSPETPYELYSDYMYGVNDVLKESYICFSSLFGQHGSPSLVDSLDFLHGISFGNFNKVGYGIDNVSDLDNNITRRGSAIVVEWADLQYIAGAGGGGSDLPVVDQGDEGKVLTVDSNGVWNDLYPEPFKLAGNIDSQTAIDVENYLSVRGGIRGDKVGNVASIYADPSVMHIGNYVDISSAKTGGFSVTKTEDSNTGVTTMALDINDIDKFMQIEAAAGSGINVTKSLDSQTHVRTYTLSGSSEISLPNYFNDFDSVMLSSWLSAFPIASDSAYHAINPGDSITMTKFSVGNTSETHQIDISVDFDVDANAPAGSYATVVLSTTQHSGTPIAVGTSISRVVGSAVDTRMLIPGVKNTFKLSLAVVFTTDTRVYINVLQNSGSSIVGTNNPYCSYKATRIGMSS